MVESERNMNRDALIESILSLKDEVVALGFDWPSEDIASVSTEDLYLFLGEVESYLYFEGYQPDELDMPW
jgi:hypothetical protein